MIILHVFIFSRHLLFWAERAVEVAHVRQLNVYALEGKLDTFPDAARNGLDVRIDGRQHFIISRSGFIPNVAVYALTCEGFVGHLPNHIARIALGAGDLFFINLGNLHFHYEGLLAFLA
jgi:hypothetical protein